MRDKNKYLGLFVLLVILAFFDSLIFKNIRLTLVFLICFSLYSKNSKAVYIFSLLGFFCDIISKTLPCFSFLYLYISLGCVWCEKKLLHISGKTVFLISFIAFLAYYFSIQIINMLIFYDVAISLSFVLKSTVFALINSSISPIIYFFVKRFEV